MKLKLLFILSTLITYQVTGQIQMNEIIKGEYEEQKFGYLTDIDELGNRIVVSQLKYPTPNTVNLGILIYENQSGSWTQLGEEIIPGLRKEIQ